MPDTILIVDDTPANLSVLADCLTQAGYALLVAEDGEDALAQTARAAPDLVLLDVMMPGLDGYETCRRLRAAPGTADVPVIFMTALSDTAEKLRAFSAGAVDYLTKPIQHEEALARIGTHLTIRRLRLQLQRELELKEKFMRVAGHDLRNPLSLITMSCDLARRRGVPPELANYFDNIQDSARHVGRIIDTFLNLQRPGGGAGRADLNLLARSAVQQQALAAERKQVTVALELEPELPAAAADASHVYQAVSNYLSNALKFLPPGGRVRVRTRREGAALRLEVADDGPGVRPEERPLLFREFVSLSNRPTAGESSTGIGLSIVRQLVEAQGGAVGADFPAAGGAVFWLSLPPAAD